MRFIDFLGNIFSKDKKIVNLKDEPSDTDVASMRLTAFAADIAVDMIAGLFSKCAFKQYENGKEQKQDTYYMLNVQPNPMENAVEFKKHLAVKLLTENEVLIINTMDAFYIAESFNVKQDMLKYPPVFTDVMVEKADHTDFTFNKTFASNEVLYIRLHDENITGLLASLDSTYTKLTNMAIAKYKRAEGRKGVLSINKTASGNATDREKQYSAIQSGFKKYYSDENGLVVIPNGMSYAETQSNAGKQGNELTNLQIITKEAFTRAAQAYKIPPAILLGDVADTSRAVDQMLTFCIDPLVALVENEFNRKLNDDRKMKTEIDIDTSTIKHTDIFDIATSIDKLIADGFTSIDELRELADLHPIGTDWSTKHWMTKNYADIETVSKGGDDSVEGGTT